MPELPDLILFARKFNAFCGDGLFQVVNGKSDASPKGLILRAFVRGKETLISCYEHFSKPPVCSYLIGFGLNGKWKYSKHSKMGTIQGFGFRSVQDNRSIALVRSVGSKVETQSGFSVSRSPCPLLEYEQWKAFIKSSVPRLQNKKIPLSAWMLDQTYFNGIGNYLRAEICARAKLDPFQEVASIVSSASTLDHLIQMTMGVVAEVVVLQFNKYGTPEEYQKFRNWCCCYDKGNHVVISQRKVFYLPVSVPVPKLMDAPEKLLPKAMKIAKEVAPSNMPGTESEPTYILTPPAKVPELSAHDMTGEDISSFLLLSPVRGKPAASPDKFLAPSSASSKKVFGRGEKHSFVEEKAPSFEFQSGVPPAMDQLNSHSSNIFQSFMNSPPRTVESMDTKSRILFLANVQNQLPGGSLPLKTWMKQTVIRRQEPSFSRLCAAVEALAADEDHDMNEFVDTLQRIFRMRN